MPSGVRAAIDANDVEALQTALSELPPAQALAMVRQLREAGLIGGGEESGPDMARVLRDFDPLLRGISAVANGEDESRAEIEAALSQLEGKGWQLADAAHHIWQGERDGEALTAGLDDQDAQVIRRVLELIAGEDPSGFSKPEGSGPPDPEAVLARMPSGVRAAIDARDVGALRAVLSAMPPEEAERIAQQLREAGIIG